MIIVNTVLNIENWIFNMSYEQLGRRSVLSDKSHRELVARYIFDHRPANLKRGDDWESYLSFCDVVNISDYFVGIVDKVSYNPNANIDKSALSDELKALALALPCLEFAETTEATENYGSFAHTKIVEALDEVRFIVTPYIM